MVVGCVWGSCRGEERRGELWILGWILGSLSKVIRGLTISSCTCGRGVAVCRNASAACADIDFGFERVHMGYEHF